MPAVTPVDVAESAFFVVACDGVGDVMTEEEVVANVSASLHTPGLGVSGAANALVEHSVSLWPTELPNEVMDNVTAIVGELL